MLTCVDAGEIGSAEVLRGTVGVGERRERHSIKRLLFK